MEKYHSFHKFFNKLSTTEQQFLKLLSICYEPVTAKNFNTILKFCQITTNSGKMFSEASVLLYEKKLKGKDLVEKAGFGEFRCHPKYTEWIMRRAIIDPDFSYFTKAIQQTLPAKMWGWKPRSFDVCIREMRLAIYTDNLTEFHVWLDHAHTTFRVKSSHFNVYRYLFDEPFEGRWLKTFSESIQDEVINYLVFNKMEALEPVDNYIEFIKTHEKFNSKTTFGKSLRAVLANIHLFQGNIQEELYLSESTGRLGWVSFLQDKNKKALQVFEESLRSFRREHNNSKIFFPHLGGIFYLLAIIKSQNKASFRKIHTYAGQGQAFNYKNIYNYLQALTYHLEFNNERVGQLMAYRPSQAIDWLFYGLVTYWTQRSFSDSELTQLSNLHKDSKKNGYLWIQMELANLLAKAPIAAQLVDQYEQEAQQLQKSLGINSIMNIVEIVEMWERSLEALINLTSTKKRSIKNEKTARLIWLIDFEGSDIQPKEQTVNKSGRWSKGRNVALKRLKEGDVKSMTEQDYQAAKGIEASYSGYYGNNDLYFNFEKTIKALVGHPLMFRMDSPEVALELVEKKMELIVEEQNNHFLIRFNHNFEAEGAMVVKETPTRYAYLNVESVHTQIARAINGNSLRVPNKAKNEVIKAIKSMASITTVHSEIEGHEEDLPKVESSSIIHVHLLPIGNGFKLEFFVKPFKDHPPYLKPGTGRKNIVTEIKGKRMMAVRDRALETENANRLEQGIPILQNTESSNGEWHFEDAEECLNVLVELEPFKEQGDIVIEWPKGEKLRVSKPAGLGNLSLKIQRNNDWFGMSGEVKLSDDMVIDMRQLLERLDNKASRFVEISDGQFVALTKDFQKRLNELNSWLHKSKNEMNFHPLAASAMEDFLGNVEELQVDKSWKLHINRLKRSHLIKTEVPSTFKAELRDYQTEGFEWLSRLAYWGVGACLADDMGLGKTIQGLAVLLDRAKKGPAFVIAPASVARNWLREAEKFTPTLNPLLFGQGDRKEMVNNLKPFDVLISSYGLLQQESELLSEQQFATVILDEAQAIKNKATKRSKAAMMLKSDFKIITTGTPIENHLGELWNLFQFLNPGLLGSIKSFQDKYAVPIEKLKDKERQKQLKKLIQPFILRRRKNDVLDELPSKTEITLSVELSESEIAFYEALRQKAVEKMTKSAQTPAGHKRMQLLAEIMRLRQACCHPKMVVPTSTLESSKLKLFGEIVEELIENGHKALVFSQFVKHLSLIEKYLNKKGISYQYLDGSTPLKKREQRIQAFQEGQGDLFLISLKAGGVGLNLTAADYVIHMDPWWNPAVEDQASDRAHRIGQKRPVTIYRLVAENTIEEKIVKLHHHKRDLADSLLEGTESSGKLSSEELLDLIQGEF